MNRTLSNGKRAILLRVRINKKPFEYQTGHAILPELWDNATNRPIKKKSVIEPFKDGNPNIDIELKNISTRLDNLTRLVKQELLASSIKDEIIDFKVLRESLNESFKKVKNSAKAERESKNKTLNEFVIKFIKGIENGTITYSTRGNVKKYSPSTIKGYKEWKTQFDLFQKATNKEYDFGDIDMEFYRRYCNYFLKKNYTTNSLGKQIKHLKAIMKRSLEKYHDNKEFLNKEFQTPSEEVESIYLTESELTRFYNYDLSDRPHLERDRDVFLIGCYTALRFSDFSRIRPEHISSIDGVDYLEIATTKTKDKVIVPIRPELKSILKKYSYKIPKTYEQKVNKSIKLIAKELKINEIETITGTIGGVSITKEYARYELIKTHTARRTGATLMYDAKIAPLDIMKITGHKKLESLLRYIKVTKKETAKKLSTNEFFTGPKLRAV